MSAYQPEEAVNALITRLEENLAAMLNTLDGEYADTLTPMEDIAMRYRAAQRKHTLWPWQVVAAAETEIISRYRHYGVRNHVIWIETGVRSRSRLAYQGVTLTPSEVATILSQRYSEAVVRVLEADPRLSLTVGYAKALETRFSEVRGDPSDEELFEKRSAVLVEITHTP